MKTYKVTIDGDAIDLYDNNSIGLAITAAVADANNLSTRKASNVKTIKFPATAFNKQKFGHPQDINSTTNISQSVKPKVVIEADGTAFFWGYAKISGTTDIATQLVTEYEMTFIGDNGDWVSKLNGLFFQNLNYSDQNHTNDYATILASETIVAGREYVYDLIDRGTFAGQPYGPAAPLLPLNSVSISDRKPAISFTSIIDRTVKLIGYKIESNFFDSAFFKSLYWPFTNDFLKHPDAFRYTLGCFVTTNAEQLVNNDYFAGAGTTINPVQKIVFPNIVTNPSGAYGLKHPSEYFCLASAQYHMVWHLDFYYNGFFGNGVIITVKKRNIYKTTSILAVKSYYPHQILGIPFSGSLSPVDIDELFTLDWGDEVYLEVDVSLAGTLVGANTVKTNAFVTYFAVSEVLGDMGMGENQLVDMNSNLPPNIPLLNIIQGLKDTFNLYFSADPDARIIYCEPYDDFYNKGILDWSKKLDRSGDVKTIFTGSQLSSVMRYAYKSDSNDKFVAAWETANNILFGSDDVPVLNVFAVDQIQVITNSLFAATWMQNCPRIGLLTTFLPQMWSDVTIPPQTTKFEPRILVYRGKKSLPAGESWRFNQFGTIIWQTANPTLGIRTDYPSFCSYDDSGPNDNNLLYCDRVYSSGVFQKYFRNAQKTLDDGRQWQAYINLNDVDMSNLDFRLDYYIEEEGNGAYFILNTITDYKSEDGISTLCLFTKITTKIAAKKLAYVVATESGSPIVVTAYSGPVSNASIGLNPLGHITVGGTTVLRRSPTGGIVDDSLLTITDGIISPMYTKGPDGNYTTITIE